VHYVKALGVGGGDLDGRPVRQRALAQAQGAGEAAPVPEDEARRRAWMDRQTREFTIPRALGVNIYCAGRGDERVTCLRHLAAVPPVSSASTPMGTYQPAPYVLPGLAARTADDPESAIRRARIASAFLCLGLVGLALAVMARGGREGVLSTLGLVTALTPAVLLTATTLNPSGPEIAGSIAFASGLLAVTRPGGRWWGAWAAVGLGGVCLAGSRSFGPLFVALGLVFVAALGRRAGLRAALAPPRAPASVAATVVLVAAAFNVAWEASKQPHERAGRADIRAGIDDAWEARSSLGEQAVGVFGRALDVDMPTVLYLGWAALFLGVLGWAIRLGSRREGLVLAGTMAVVLLSVFALSIGVRPTGFPAQARHLLPLAVLVPIGAGEVLRRHAAQVPPATARLALLGAVGLAAAVHLGAWFVNARAWEGWSPPLSWGVWAGALVFAAAAALGATAAGGSAAPGSR
jgi:Predicted membrane protein (DUF2142)